MDQTCRIEAGIDHNLAETFLPINSHRQPFKRLLFKLPLFLFRFSF